MDNLVEALHLRRITDHNKAIPCLQTNSKLNTYVFHHLIVIKQFRHLLIPIPFVKLPIILPIYV